MDAKNHGPVPREIHPAPNTWPVLTDLQTGRAVAFNPAMVRAIMPGREGTMIFVDGLGWEVKEGWDTVIARLQGRVLPEINRIGPVVPHATARAWSDEEKRARSLFAGPDWVPPGWALMDSAPRNGMIEVLATADGPALKVVWRQGTFASVYAWYSVVTGIEVKPICWREVQP